MNHSEQLALVPELNLSDDEKKKRQGLASKKPHVAAKLAKISEMVQEVSMRSPTSRLK